MNFFIKRFNDVQMILRVLSLWIFLQVIFDICSYAVLLYSDPTSVVYQVGEYVGYRVIIADVFISCALLLLPYFFFVLFRRHSVWARKIGQATIALLFIVAMTWVVIVANTLHIEHSSILHFFAIYCGNVVECLLLAWLFAWNINQFMKYELDYGMLKVVPEEFHHLTDKI